MSPWYAKAVFRLRVLAQRHLVMACRVAWWRALGMSIGRGSAVHRVFVTWPHQVSLGADCLLEHGSYFKFDGIYRPGPSLVFSDGVFIGAGCEFNITCGLRVGAHSLIASGCKFVDHDHGFVDRTIPMDQQTTGLEAPIDIGPDVWIGANVVVLKGVCIGHGAIVAAGSVLTRSVGAYEIWGGVPARKLRDRPGAESA